MSDEPPTPTPHERPGRQHSSARAISWAEEARSLSDRVAAMGHEALAADLLLVAHDLHLWREQPPVESVRQETIKRYFELACEAMRILGD